MLPLLLTSVLFASGPAQNLIVNGNFEGDPKTVLTAYRKGDSIFDSGTCAVTTDPHQQHSGAASIRDHTGRGGGKMLAFNGSEEKGAAAWQTTVSVTPDKDYTLIGWATSWSMDVNTGEATDPSPAVLRILINGKPTCAVFGVNAKSGNWSKFTYTFRAERTKTVTIKIVDANVDGYGNDFALDDLSLVESLPRGTAGSQ